MTVPFPSSVQRARTLARPAGASSDSLLAPGRIAGRLVELSEAGAFGALSVVAEVIRDVQVRGEAVAWVAGSSVFFPPDLAFRGIDVQALCVVRVPGEPGLRAADWLVRSGAFGLVVVDGGEAPANEGVLGRLAKLADEKQTTVVFLTRKRATDPSLGALVSLRLGLVSLAGGEVELTVLKDKRAGSPVTQRITFHGPFGLY